MTNYVLAIDQGTTSSRSLIFDDQFKVLAKAQNELKQYFPQPGWVEHDPEEIWQSSINTAKTALAMADLNASDIAAIGIANQRETVVLWDRDTGKAIHPAIVWQDRRTADKCRQLKDDGLEQIIIEKTGLRLDPYFCATKIAWLLDNIAGARRKAQEGRLAFGTVDSFLLWRLTGGKAHISDPTNASRTLLYDIAKGQWCDQLLEIFEIPRSLLPQVKNCADHFGVTSPDIFGNPIKIAAMIGDQQAATIGQSCFSPGMTKATYGTGCFALLNTGGQLILSNHKLLTTIAYQLNDQVAYAIEGSIFTAGAVVQWLRDGLRIIESASQCDQLASLADPAQRIYLIPAFVGLGAPYWDPDCRGAIFGLTLGCGRSELVRAALESVCYQTNDLLKAMTSDWDIGHNPVLRVDGGMAKSAWTMQFLADLTGINVELPTILETTAVGAGYLAGLQAGIYPKPEHFQTLWRCQKHYTPRLDERERNQLDQGWQDAVARTLSRR